MKKSALFLTILSLLLCMAQAFAEDGVASIIIVRGEVKAKEKGSENIITVTKGMWLKEGTVIQSAPKSFAKLLFIDKSEMSLGPESQMVINSFPKDQAGILTLVKGQLRSKVTKDYMDMEEKDKSKLYIKTKSAAMGVRGTDFQVNFDRSSSATTLVTFSGAVAMTQLSETAGRVFDRNALEGALRSKEAVIVQKGEFAGTSLKQPASAPEKLPADKLEVLQSTNGTTVAKEVMSDLISTVAKEEVKEEKKEEKKEDKKDVKEEKKDEKQDEKKEDKIEEKKEEKKEEKPETASVRSIVPPGLSAEMVNNVGGGELEKSLAASIGTGALTELKTAAMTEIKNDLARAPASLDGGIIAPVVGSAPPPPAPPMLPPPPPPPIINEQQLNNIVNDTYKAYNNAPPPAIPDPNTRVRFIFH